MNSIVRRAILIAGLLALVGVLGPAAALGKAGGTDRPFKGEVEGVNYVNLANGEVYDEVLRGRATHWGKVTIYVHGWVRPTGTPGNFTFSTDMWEAVVANGDTLVGECSGPGTTPVPPVLGTVAHGVWSCTLTGGTGRFEDVTGSFDANIRAERLTNPPILQQAVSAKVSSGKISY